MAFFGEDGLQRQLKQAQRDLMEKDREIGSMHLSAKDKDEALRKLRLEIERLKEEKEDLALHGAGSSSHSDAHDDEKKRLKSELKDAQDALNKSLVDINRLKEEARQTSVQLNDVRIRKISGSTSSSYNLASPSSQRSSRRRSTSLSSDTRVQDLEAELSLLRQTAGSNEVESIKTQLATVKRELDKAINEKIAIESKARKEVESIRNQLYDANFELDGIRRDMEDGGSVSKQDLEKRQKAWEGEKAELAATVKDLERVVADGKLELGELRDAADEVQRLRQELDSERSKQVIVAPIAVDHTEELARLTGEVTSLQAELARAKASTPPSSAVANTSSADLTIRRLERKLDKAQRDAEALEESLNQAEEENQALRSRVPLPGSPGKKVDDGRVMELEVDNENLQAEVSQLRNQVQSLRDDLEILQAAHARAEQAEQALQTAQGDIGSKEVAWRAERKIFDEQTSALRQSITQAEESVLAKAAEIIEKEEMLSALSANQAASASRVEDLEKQLVEALAQPRVSQLENEISTLKDSMDSINKEKEALARESAQFQDQMQILTADLASTREDLQLDRAELDVLRVRLADVSRNEVALQGQLEAVQERLDTAIHEKMNIENELSQVRDLMANRSTESEAEGRNGDLLTLQTQLDAARAALDDKEREMEQEIAGLRFIHEKQAEKMADTHAQLSTAQQNALGVETKLQTRISALEADLEVSHKRVQDLESEIATVRSEALTPKAVPRAPSTPDRLGLLYSKIQSLRAERDELRQSLSFAQNESKFTIRAAQADRESAIEELEAVKSDLNNQLAVHESLEQEVSSVRSQLSEKEIKLEDVKNLYTGATIDKGDVADKIAQYESEVASAKAERDHLVNELGESQRQIMELNHAMAMMRTNTETDKRMRKISMERKIVEMPKITETSAGAAIDRGPVSLGSSRRPVHTRTRSEIASLVLPDQAQITVLTAKVSELELAVRELAGKLERRNATITSLQRENEKLNMAQELSKESAEEFEELVSERDDLQVELEKVRSELSSTTADIASHVARVAEIESLNANLRSEKDSGLATIALQTDRIAGLESEVASTLADVTSARSLIESHSVTISQLEGDMSNAAAQSDEHGRSLVVNLLAQRRRLASATTSWRKASSHLQVQNAALEASTSQVKSLVAHVDSFEAERSAMTQQLQSHTQRGKALDVANEKVHELESQVETLEAECASMGEQLDEVTAREQALLKQMEEGSATQRSLHEVTLRAEKTDNELLETREEITRLQAEIAAAKDTMSTNDSVQAQVEKDLKQELSELKAMLADSEDRTSKASEDKDRLSGRVEEIERLLGASDAENQTLRKTVDDLTKEVELKTTEATDLASLCDDLRLEVANLTTKLDNATESATDHTLALQSEKAQLQQQLESATEKAEALRMEVSSTMNKNQRLITETTSLSTELKNVKATLAKQEEAVEGMKSDMHKLEKEKEKTVGLLKYQETETISRSNKVQTLERELQTYRAGLAKANEALAQRTDESAKLEAQCAELRSALADAQTNAGGEVDEELLERIQELEASLTLKTQEVDEADDRTRDAFKANVKLEKKIAKLTRQLGDKELEMNTKRNKVIAIPDAAPVSRPAQMAPPAHTAPSTQRAPLRSVGNLEPALLSTPGSLKRVREGEPEKALPAEAIMLPPSAPTLISSKTPTKRSFTPKRNVGGGVENQSKYASGLGSVPRPNIFASRPNEI